MQIDQAKIEAMRVEFFDAAKNFPGTELPRLMREYSERLGRDGEEGARRYLTLLAQGPHQ